MLRLKGNANGEYQRVVVGMKVGQCDLLPGSKRQPRPIVQRNAPDNDAWCRERLRFTVVCSALVEAAIELDLRPQEAGSTRLCDAILDGIVPGNRVSKSN